MHFDWLTVYIRQDDIRQLKFSRHDGKKDFSRHLFDFTGFSLISRRRGSHKATVDVTYADHRPRGSKMYVIRRR